MAMRCSLLGHDFGTAEVEREREERGSEVVVTVTEYEECARCGEINVISENTEVTSLGSATDAADESDDPPTDAAEQDAAVDGPHETAASTDENDESLADDPTEDVPVDDGDDPDQPAVDGPPAADSPVDDVSVDDADAPEDDSPEDDAITDDGEILAEAADDPEPDRERGEWPDSEDVGPPVGAENEPATWPEDESDAGDDAEILGADDAPEADASAEAATGPDSAASRTESDTAVPETESGSGIASAQAAPAPGEGARSEGVNTEFFCPRCDFVAPGDRGSLRSGDICPDCRKGYLSERER